MKVLDLYDVLSPILGPCRFFPIFQMTLRGSTNDKKHSTSYVHVVFGTIVSILVAIPLISGIFEPEFVTWVSSESLVTKSMYSQFALVLLLMVVESVSCFYNRIQIANVIKIINLQDSALKKLGATINYPAEFRRCWIHLGSVCLILFMITVVQLVSEFDIFMSYPIAWFAWLYPIFVSDLCTCFFAAITLAIRQRFIMINEILQNLCDEINSPMLNIVSGQRKHISKIQSIAIVHGTLCDAAKNLSEAFGPVFVVIVANGFVMLTTALYMTFREIQYPKTTFDLLCILHYFDWGLLNNVSVIYIVIVCTSTVTQAERTANLVHKVKVTGSDIPLATTIQLFSSQLQHTTVKFSAVGFFNMDPALIQSMIGTVTTYLIILIQFDAMLSHRV